MIDVIAKNKELKEKFKDVSFQEEGHLYTIKGHENKPIKSVSSLLHYFVDEFNEDFCVSKPYAKTRGFNHDDVLRAWEGEGLIATTHGSKVHLYAEQYLCDKYLGTNFNPVVFDKQSLGAQQFLNDLPDYFPCVASELVMYHPKYWYTGTADIIAYNCKSLKLNILDWKSNQEIESKGPFKKPPLKIIPPELGLVQDNFGKYSLQFSFYQIMLEDMGYEVENRVLIHLTDDRSKKKLYKTYRTPDLTKYLREWLETKEHLK